MALACVQPLRPDDTAPIPSGTPPVITTIAWSCSMEKETWSFRVDTEGWTGNGDLWWAEEPGYVEDHPLASEESGADGSYDVLTLDLGIVADWRYAVSGSSTAFQCTEDQQAALQVRIVIYNPGTDEAGDCRSWGPDPTFFDFIPEVPACDMIWEGE